MASDILQAKGIEVFECRTVAVVIEIARDDNSGMRIYRRKDFLQLQNDLFSVRPGGSLASISAGTMNYENMKGIARGRAALYIKDVARGAHTR